MRTYNQKLMVIVKKFIIHQLHKLKMETETNLFKKKQWTIKIIKKKQTLNRNIKNKSR